MHKNSYVIPNTCIYIQKLCHLNLKQQTKIFFKCNLLCSRAEFPCIWKIVRKAKLFDCFVLFLLDQKGIMKHLSSDQ